MELTIPQVDLLSQIELGSDDEVRTQVMGLLAALYPRNDIIERRQENRYPFPCRVYLTPVAKDGVTPEGDTIVVIGRDISEHGLGFYHQIPLPYRRMIASLQCGKGRWMAFIIDLSWCRFTQGGWYESGGRLLQAVTSPMECQTAVSSGSRDW